jgi:tetratricopeptide (TPR) repeat protein
LSAELSTLRKALAYSQAGRRQDAERLYCEILRRDPANADALHLLGLLYLETGQAQQAAGLVSLAIQQQPDVPFFYNTLGNAFRGLGKAEQARVCFRKAIALKPDFAEALTNLGCALEEIGEAGEAIACHRRAASIQPNSAEIHGNLGNALRSEGQADAALAEYTVAIRLNPGFAQLWINRGNVFFDREEFFKAEEHYRQAVRLDPRLPAAQSNLGSALSQLGQLTEAEEWCRKALEAAPGDPLAQCNLASVLVMRGRAEPAAELCLRALASKPDMPEAHTNLGMALARLHRLDEAERHCRESLRLRPNRPNAYANLAHVLTVTGRFEEAEECLRRALELRPDHLRVLGSYGDLCAAQLDFAGALRWYDRVEELAPEGGLMRPARAMVRLATGDFERGWEEYESRWKLAECPSREFAKPVWTGDPFPGRTVLLHTEQGLGDTLQFVRFVRPVKQLGGRVILACQEALIPLLLEVEGADQVVPVDGELPDFDYRLPLLSAPRVLGTREETIPRNVPYLKVPDDAIAGARERLSERCGAPDGRLRVGIVWAGNPAHPDDSNRSMKWEHVKPLLRISGVQFLSLQQHRTIPEGCPLIPVVDDSDSIATTAAIVLQLDLTITVDTMIAHLAGGLGRPVWTLHKLAADWRWMAGREDSPWYPGMRLFRQSRFGDWEGVVQRVGAALTTISSRSGHPLRYELQRREIKGRPGKMPGTNLIGKG